MRALLLACAALLFAAVPTSAATVSQYVVPTGLALQRTLVIAGDAADDRVEVLSAGAGAPLGEVVIRSTAPLGVAPSTPECSLVAPGEVRCAAAAAGPAGETAIRFLGGPGADRLRPTAGFSLQFEGGTGDDRLEPAPGQRLPVVAIGGPGDDVLAGGAGIDRLTGGAGDDRLTGGAEADRLDGGDGADVLLGGAGRDTLRGGAGTDVVRARAGGRDDVDCGAGRRDRAEHDATDRVRSCERRTHRP